jgi:hypothetical protein
MVTQPIVAVVGVCASGKTTLVKSLQAFGVQAYNVAQEHSCVKQFWRRKCPDILVLLDVTLPFIRRRRIVPWGEERLVAQRERLADAKKNADLCILTDFLSAEEVVQVVCDYIENNCKLS